MVKTQQAKTSMSYIQSISSIEGTTVHAKQYTAVSMGKRAKMKHGDAYVFLVPTKKRDFDDSVITPATAHRFVNGFSLSHLQHVVMWLWSSGKITSCRQIAQHGWVGDMWRWKATGKLAGTTKSHVVRTPIADSGRFFTEALPFGHS